MGQKSITGAEAVLRSLKQNGVDYVFANPGSDFAPIIEAYATQGISEALPEYLIAPFENVCVAMAHGYYLATGKVQAAMVHVNVGLANATMGMLNARADDVPIFLTSGRTPLTEHDREGARLTPIQYGQEQFDQTAMVREAVKWEYELRYAENAANLVSRGLSIARSAPEGAVYMSLPREPLCELIDDLPPEPIQTAATPAHPDPAHISAAAEKLAAAENPLIVCCRGDAAGKVSEQLRGLANENSIAISEVFVTRNVLPSDEPMLIGPDLNTHLPDADVVLVVDCGVAWVEALVQPSPDAEVIHLGPDPLFSRMPVRSYRTTMAIQSDTAAGLAALRDAMPGKPDAERDAKIRAMHTEFRGRIDAMAEAGSKGVANKAFVSQCISNVLGEDGVVINERGGNAPTYTLCGPNRWFGNTQAGGLGWCLPAALGYQLADRDRLVVSIVGDGSYMFANPVACHQVAEAHNLPLLTVILNNDGYDAVRVTTREVYPDGDAAQSNEVPMAPFGANPDYSAIARASRAWTRKVEFAEDLPGAFEEAVEVIRTEKRQALIDVTVQKA